MTLKARNRMFLIFSILTASFSMVLAGHFIYYALTGAIIPPETNIRPLNFSSNSIIFNTNFYCTIAGIFLFMLYVPVTFMAVYLGFEKTQSFEIIFFIGFLFGCFLETARIFLPIKELWKTSSSTLLLLGRLVLIGRMLSPLSLLFASFFGEKSEHENLSRNFLILVLVSLTVGLNIPLDSYHVATNCTVLWSFKNLFFSTRFCICCATFVSLLLNSYSKDSQSLRRCSFYYVILIVGYALLTSADNIFILSISSVLLTTGTILYLRGIHSLYMWR